jgi:hypothetical protein
MKHANCSYQASSVPLVLSHVSCFLGSPHVASIYLSLVNQSYSRYSYPLHYHSISLYLDFSISILHTLETDISLHPRGSLLTPILSYPILDPISPTAPIPPHCPSPKPKNLSSQHSHSLAHRIDTHNLSISLKRPRPSSNHPPPPLDIPYFRPHYH